MDERRFTYPENKSMAFTDLEMVSKEHVHIQLEVVQDHGKSFINLNVNHGGNNFASLRKTDVDNLITALQYFRENYELNDKLGF